MKKIIGLLLVLGSFNLFGAQTVYEELESVTVLVRSDSGEGTGTIITRNGVQYVLSASHVTDSSRHVRKVVNPKDGSVHYVVTYSPVKIVKDIYDGDKVVGTTVLEADIVKMSDADYGQDIVILKVRKSGLPSVSTRFYLDNAAIPVGTPLYHVGALFGNIGQNSFTTGVLSQVGRVVDNKSFYQTSVTACPGSSGGGIFLTDGRWCGMLVRGYSKTTEFNLFTPMWRIKEWAKRADVMWLFDDKLPVTELKDVELIDEEAPIVEGNSLPNFGE